MFIIVLLFCLSIPESLEARVKLTNEEERLLRKLDINDEPHPEGLAQPSRNPLRERIQGLETKASRVFFRGGSNSTAKNNSKTEKVNHFDKRNYRTLLGPTQLQKVKVVEEIVDGCKDKTLKETITTSGGESLMKIVTGASKGILSARHIDTAGGSSKICVEIGRDFGNSRCLSYNATERTLECKNGRSILCGPVMTCSSMEAKGHIRCHPKVTNKDACYPSKCPPHRSVCLYYGKGVSECVKIQKDINELNCDALLCPPASSCLFTPSHEKTPATAFCFLNSPKSLTMIPEEALLNNNALIRIVLRLLMTITFN